MFLVRGRTRRSRRVRHVWIAGLVEFCVGVLGAVAWLAVIASLDRDAWRIG